MKRKILIALLVFALNALGGCSSSGTHTCTATGLIAGQVYAYSYVDSAGNEYSGKFTAEGPTYDVPNVPSSIDCSSMDIGVVQPVYNLA